MHKRQHKGGRPVDVAGFAARKRKQLGLKPQKPSSSPWVEKPGGTLTKRKKSNHYGSY